MAEIAQRQRADAYSVRASRLDCEISRKRGGRVAILQRGTVACIQPVHEDALGLDCQARACGLFDDAAASDTYELGVEVSTVDFADL